jgi:hypothetical protein
MSDELANGILVDVVPRKARHPQPNREVLSAGIENAANGGLVAEGREVFLIGRKVG